MLLQRIVRLAVLVQQTELTTTSLLWEIFVDEIASQMKCQTKLSMLLHATFPVLILNYAFVVLRCLCCNCVKAITIVDTEEHASGQQHFLTVGFVRVNIVMQGH